MKTPKDLGIVIGSKEGKEFKDILEAQEEVLLKSKINIEVAEIVIELAKKRIAEETEKFK